MRHTVSAPVTWPDRAALDRWWAEGVAEVQRTEVEYDGTIREPDARPGAASIRLVSGTHLAPGAAYVLQGVDLGSTLSVSGTVTGVAGRRVVRVVAEGRRPLLDLGSGPLAEMVVDGLDTFGVAAVTSSHPYVSGTLRLTPDPQAPLDLILRLRWLGVRLHAEVTPDDRLSVTAELEARGVWSPATAPLIAVLGRLLTSGMQEAVTRCAEDLTAVAEGREPPSRVRARTIRQRLENARWAKARLRERLEATEDALAGKGWWATRRRAWLRTYDDLPPTAWPPRQADPRDAGDPDHPVGPPTTWETLAHRAAEAVALQPRAERRQAIQQQLDGFASIELIPDQVEPVPPGALVVTEEDLELRWLRSPRTTWNYLREAGAVSEDPPPDTEPPGPT